MDAHISLTQAIISALLLEVKIRGIIGEGRGACTDYVSCFGMKKLPWEGPGY